MNNKTVISLLIALLPLSTGGLIWAGSLNHRVDAMENRGQVYEQDHDIIIRLDTQQKMMMQKLEEMDRKLDKLGEDT